MKGLMITACHLRSLIAFVLTLQAGLLLFPACSGSTSETASDPVNPVPVCSLCSYEVVNTFPHDRKAFTQGFVSENGFWYEGTGLWGESSLRKVDPKTGEVLKIYELPADLFGEGITIFDDRIIQLTWRSHKGFIYDKETFDLLQEFPYPTEGWGITHDGTRLIMSDGTARLYFLDPLSLETKGYIEVWDENGPVTRLNELEYVQGEIFANVWQTNSIVRIDPVTGQVTGSIDMTGVLTSEDRSEPVDVLNGIAYDSQEGRLFVTGKLWPRVFEIRVVPL